MFQDEDGYLAHEFYEEIAPSNGRPWMKRITENLIEQVNSYYKIIALF